MENSVHKKSHKFWDDEVKQSKLVYVDTQVVRFMSGCRPDLADNAGKKAIEIACGGGRNLIVLDDYGFEAHGLDFAENAIREAQSLGARNKREFTLHHSSLEDFADTTDQKFDVVIWDSPFLAPQIDIENNLKRIHQIFSEGGVGWFAFRHPDTWFSKFGVAVDENCYELDERAVGYEGAIYSFFEEAEARSLLGDADFDVLNVERVELWKKGMSERNVWMHFWVTPK